MSPSICFDPEAVCVYKNRKGEESIQYHPSKMDKGKLYPVEYNGEHWALKKNRKSVSLMLLHEEIEISNG